MRVYNLNKAIGLASSGVEYAQKYRREALAGIPWIDDHYVFTDYLPTNLCVFTDRLRFDRGQVLWIYNLVTGRDTVPCTMTVDDVLSSLRQPHSAPVVRGDRFEVAVAGSAVGYRIRTVPGGLAASLETVVGGRVVRIEHYDETLNNVEHFHLGRLARRVFYTADGRVAAEQFYSADELVQTRITRASPLHDGALAHGRRRLTSFRGDVVLDGRAQFLEFVLGQLFSRADDVVIVDRALDVIDAVYRVIGDRRLYSVVHAEHFDLTQAEDDVMLWNNHYEHVFTRPELVDGVIVSTERQREVLEAQLVARYGDGAPRVVRIPVGFVTSAVAQPRYDKLALVTASRLADEKHLDLLVRAVSLARRTLPGLRLDIYGEGNRDHLLAVIEEEQADGYVSLLGHRRLDGLLGSYGLYVSASTSEGFGLSSLEAIAEGLPVVGFDVDYGNRELVESGVNGRLVQYTSTPRDVAAIAEAVVEVLSSPSFDELRAGSARKARDYSLASVTELWARLLEQQC